MEREFSVAKLFAYPLTRDDAEERAVRHLKTGCSSLRSAKAPCRSILCADQRESCLTPFLGIAFGKNDAVGRWGGAGESQDMRFIQERARGLNRQKGTPDNAGFFLSALG